MDVTIEIEPLKLSLPDNSLDGNKLEEIILQTSRDHGCRMMEKMLGIIDEALMKTRDKELKLVGLKHKLLNTRMGEVILNRRYYKDREGNYHYLLDKHMGWEKHQRSSCGYMQEALAQGSQQSYRRAKEELAKQTGSLISHETVRTWVGKVGSEINQAQSEQAFAVFELGETIEPSKEVERLFLEADGKWLSVRNKDGVKKEEMKLGVLYEGWEPRYANGKQDTFKLSGKYAFGGMYSAEEFRARLACLGESKAGLSKAKQIFWGGDGASWCKAGVKDYPQAIYHLCPFHMHREVRRTFGIDNRTAKGLQQLLYESDHQKVRAFLDNCLWGAPEQARKKRLRLRKYILNNWDGILGWRKVRQALGAVAHGYLGAIEGNVDKLLVRRFTDRGACWSRSGAHNLALVRLAWTNQELSSVFTWLKTRGHRVLEDAPQQRKSKLQEFWRKGSLPALQIAISKPWQRVLKNLVYEVALP